ncbi:protein kinase domain-containing protein [Methyloprofundus sp.]|uniref:protein kinase domain-containing protein n=1 Tax=Methyloprofundus sp. TaxID=2020875 RepID=UPI003D0ADA98
MTDHEQTLKPGSQLEEFSIERILGEGGFGITYLAFDQHFQKHVAIKEYFYASWCYRSEGNSVNSRTNHKEDFKYGLDSFLQEARTLAQFEHPNIVKVIRFFKANGTAYIVMEYIEGQTLGSKIDEFNNESGQGMFNEEEMLFVLQPIISGLKQLHRANVYHRDLKPDNIMLRENGSPVLIDFGAAREAAGNKSQNLSMIVTEGYSPLEQYNNSSVQGPWTDIYALAAVAYTCLTGEKPSDATHRVLDDQLIPLVEVARDQGSLNFLKAVDNGLAIRPTDRPQTLDEWWEQLIQGEQEEVNEVKATRGNDVYLKETLEESQANQGCQRSISYQGKKYNVTVPDGTKPGTQLKLSGKGERGKNGGENGDLYIEVKVKKPKPKTGDYIFRVENISAEIAKMGGEIEIATTDGDYEFFSIPKNTSDGDNFTLLGKGYPGKNGGQHGDLFWLCIR